MKIKDYEMACIAMAIDNHTNEVNEVPVNIRQLNNDKCFDFAIKQIEDYIEFREE